MRHQQQQGREPSPVLQDIAGDVDLRRVDARKRRHQLRARPHPLARHVQPEVQPGRQAKINTNSNATTPQPNQERTGAGSGWGWLRSHQAPLLKAWRATRVYGAFMFKTEPGHVSTQLPMYQPAGRPEIAGPKSSVESAV